MAEEFPKGVRMGGGDGGGPGGDIPAVRVTLNRAEVQPTSDQLLWVVIRNRTNAISFMRYKEFIDSVMGGTKEVSRTGTLPFPGVDAYHLLKVATEFFLMQEVGVLDITQALRDLGEDEKREKHEKHEKTSEAAEKGLREALADANRLQPDEEASRLGFSPTIRELKKMRDTYYIDLPRHSHVVLPYMERILEKLQDVPLKGPAETPATSYGIQISKVIGPLAMELIWSYWHEEGMLVQSLNAISMRFQNRRINGDRDPLAGLEIDPLRPLNNLLWGYIQDELHRLTVVRRAYEYDHQYGLRLYGKAVPDLRTADSRSKFLEAFHRLLKLCSNFYKQDDDTTVIADGFPVLNGLKEVHLLLSEGQHNQYGDLPWTARIEMMIQQWLLARPEMREFIPGRTMVAYPEPWMDRVDALKRLEGWNDTPVLHFRDLGVFGEQILLSIRYGDWSSVIDRTQAANWARYWRPEIQGYIHAYRAATGVDLTLDPVDATLPSELLRRRISHSSGR